jgi:putative salt-induced outer membrane protein YdiY
MRARFLFIALLAAHVHAGPASAQAQAPPPPPKIWTVAMGAGWAMTSGNSDTSNLNASYDIVYDPQRKNVVKSDGLFLRAKTEGELTANRLGFNIRDEYHPEERRRRPDVGRLQELNEAGLSVRSPPPR